MTDYFEILEPGNVYHVYNKAVGDELIFRSEQDYYYFKKKVKRFISPICDLYAYCLMPNHFHLLLATKEVIESEPVSSELLKKRFSNFFNSYAKSYNNAHKRMGKLFNLPFRRILVESDDYFTSLVCYIHRNPLHHGISKSFSTFKYSSFQDILVQDDFVDSEYVLEWFGGLDNFILFHEENIAFENTDRFKLES
jgi:putative transposase